MPNSSGADFEPNSVPLALAERMAKALKRVQKLFMGEAGVYPLLSSDEWVSVDVTYGDARAVDKALAAYRAHREGK